MMFKKLFKIKYTNNLLYKNFCYTKINSLENIKNLKNLNDMMKYFNNYKNDLPINELNLLILNILKKKYQLKKTDWELIINKINNCNFVINENNFVNLIKILKNENKIQLINKNKRNELIKIYEDYSNNEKLFLSNELEILEIFTYLNHKTNEISNQILKTIKKISNIKINIIIKILDIFKINKSLNMNYIWNLIFNKFENFILRSLLEDKLKIFYLISFLQLNYERLFDKYPKILFLLRDDIINNLNSLKSVDILEIVNSYKFLDNSFDNKLIESIRRLVINQLENNYGNSNDLVFLIKFYIKNKELNKLIFNETKYNFILQKIINILSSNKINFDDFKMILNITNFFKEKNFFTDFIYKVIIKENFKLKFKYLELLIKYRYFDLKNDNFLNYLEYEKGSVNNLRISIILNKELNINELKLLNNKQIIYLLQTQVKNESLINFIFNNIERFKNDFEIILLLSNNNELKNKLLNINYNSNNVFFNLQKIKFYNNINVLVLFKFFEDNKENLELNLLFKLLFEKDDLFKLLKSNYYLLLYIINTIKTLKFNENINLFKLIKKWYNHNTSLYIIEELTYNYLKFEIKNNTLLSSEMLCYLLNNFIFIDNFDLNIYNFILKKIDYNNFNPYFIDFIFKANHYIKDNDKISNYIINYNENLNKLEKINNNKLINLLYLENFNNIDTINIENFRLNDYLKIFEIFYLKMNNLNNDVKSKIKDLLKKYFINKQLHFNKNQWIKLLYYSKLIKLKDISYLNEICEKILIFKNQIFDSDFYKIVNNFFELDYFNKNLVDNLFSNKNFRINNLKLIEKIGFVDYDLDIIKLKNININFNLFLIISNWYFIKYSKIEECLKKINLLFDKTNLDLNNIFFSKNNYISLIIFKSLEKDYIIKNDLIKIVNKWLNSNINIKFQNNNIKEIDNIIKYLDILNVDYENIVINNYSMNAIYIKKNNLIIYFLNKFSYFRNEKKLLKGSFKLEKKLLELNYKNINIKELNINQFNDFKTENEKKDYLKNLNKI